MHMSILYIHAEKSHKNFTWTTDAPAQYGFVDKCIEFDTSYMPGPIYLRDCSHAKVPHTVVEITYSSTESEN